VTDGAFDGPVYHVGVTPVPYTVERDPEADAVDLSMTADATVTVSAPPSATPADVEETLDARQAWLLDSLYGLAARPRRGRRFERSEKLRYGGRRYPLTVAESQIDSPRLTFDGSRFLLRIPRRGAIRDARRRAVHEWYLDRASDVLPECAADVATETPPTVCVGSPDRRWVRDAGDRLDLHWRLVLLPRPVAGYAVAHALVRRTHDPSDPEFWTALDARVSNAQSRGTWLRRNGGRVRI